MESVNTPKGLYNCVLIKILFIVNLKVLFVITKMRSLTFNWSKSFNVKLLYIKVNKVRLF